MEEKQLNEKESLELISRMIRNTQNHLEGNEGIPFIVWGYVTLLTTVAVWCAVHFTDNHYWHFLWIAIPVIGTILSLILNKRHPDTVKTYIDKTIGYVWVVLGTACFVFSAVAFMRSLNILMIVLLLIGAGSTITGLIVKYLPVAIGGVIAMILSVILLFVPQTFDIYMLTFSLGFIAMCIIPGHCLNYKVHKEAKKVHHV